MFVSVGLGGSSEAVLESSVHTAIPSQRLPSEPYVSRVMSIVYAAVDVSIDPLGVRVISAQMISSASGINLS